MNRSNCAAWAKAIESLLGVSHSRKIERAGYLPLCLERIEQAPDGVTQVSVAHYGEQNGDLMADPEIVFRLWRSPLGEQLAIPAYVKQDYVGREAWVYEFAGAKCTGVREGLLADLSEFSAIWLANLKAQGFLDG